MNVLELNDIKSGPTTDAEANLTQLEYVAMNSTLNLADGHARQQLSAGQASIIEDLPALFREAERTSVDILERRAHTAFFEMLGQHSYPGHTTERVLPCYASSVAMEILARALATTVDTVALVHPTFDNIPDILRGVGIELIPIEEDVLHAGDLPDELFQGVGAVFITTPNNPTGRVVSQERLLRLALQCADRDVILCLDTSFRGFDVAAQYDHYAILEESGCRWAVVEDTGKLWPTLDLKIGWLTSSADIGIPVGKIYSDILLGVSPLILSLVHRFAEDGAAGGLTELQSFIGDNRNIVRSTLSGISGVTFPDTASRGSVERIFLGDRSAMDIWRRLADLQVYALPCHKFHWAHPEAGRNSLRLALARSTPIITRSASIVADVLGSEE